LYSPEINIFDKDKFLDKITVSPVSGQKLNYETIFYGRGRGIHSTTPFSGELLKGALEQYFNLSHENLRNGYFVIVSVDGYRCVFTYSEIFNRNDQSELLLVREKENNDGGAFRLFPSADFFSDRAIKAVSEIRLMKE